MGEGDFAGRCGRARGCAERADGAAARRRAWESSTPLPTSPTFSLRWSIVCCSQKMMFLISCCETERVACRYAVMIVSVVSSVSSARSPPAPTRAMRRWYCRDRAEPRRSAGGEPRGDRWRSVAGAEGEQGDGARDRRRHSRAWCDQPMRRSISLGSSGSVPGVGTPPPAAGGAPSSRSCRTSSVCAIVKKRRCIASALRAKTSARGGIAARASLSTCGGGGGGAGGSSGQRWLGAGGAGSKRRACAHVCQSGPLISASAA